MPESTLRLIDCNGFTPDTLKLTGLTAEQIRDGIDRLRMGIAVIEASIDDLERALDGAR